MKKHLLIWFLSFNALLNAQEWQTIPNSYFGTCCDFNNQPDFNHKYFEINPYTNDMWMCSILGTVYQINNTGDFIIHGWPDTTIFGFSDEIMDFNFTSKNTFVAIRSKGVFRFNHQFWDHPVTMTTCSTLATYGDTLWAMDQFDYFLRFDNNGIYNYSNQPFEKAASRNGVLWGASPPSLLISRYENEIKYTYLDDTCSLIYGEINDFKYSNADGKFYTGGQNGLSIATGEIFKDSIDSNSSTNMPPGDIIEFEFDQQNNIWALFGNAENAFTFTNSGIGYYEQATRSWTKYYDGSNSPIDFSIPVTIETDSSGNLWVAQKDRLHVLKTGNTPAWLGIAEQKHSSTFSLSPNPGTDILNIRLPQPNSTTALIQVWDATGKLLESKNLLTGEQEVSWNLSSLAPGCYQITIEDQNQSSFPQCWIKL